MRSLATMIVLVSNCAFAQITGNTNVIDPKALKIDSTMLSQLLGKKWKCEQVIETRRGEIEAHDGPDFSLEMLPNGRTINSTSWRTDSGTWKIVNRQYLILSSPEPRNRERRLIGSFSVYKRSDSIVILARVLTSSGDWRKEYVIRNQKYPSPIRNKNTTGPIQAPYFPTEDSLRAGKRIRFDTDGRRIETYYSIIKEKISAEEVFLNRWGLNNSRFDRRDSTYTRSVESGPRSTYSVDGVLLERRFFNNRGWEVFTDRYVYDNHKKFSHIVRERWKAHTVILKDSLQLYSHKLQTIGRAGSITHQSIKIKNLSERAVTLYISENKTLLMSSSHHLLKAHDSLLLDLELPLPPGDSREKILVGSGDQKFPIEFNSFGYHMTVDDFNNEDHMVLPTLFYFHRSEEEFQLQIERSGVPKSGKFFPISMQMVPIELKNGKYLFTLTSPSIRKKKQVEIK